MRDDGKKMWAHKGKPLYSFKQHVPAGDVEGDGFNNATWPFAKP